MTAVETDVLDGSSSLYTRVGLATPTRVTHAQESTFVRAQLVGWEAG